MNLRLLIIILCIYYVVLILAVHYFYPSILALLMFLSKRLVFYGLEINFITTSKKGNKTNINMQIITVRLYVYLYYLYIDQLWLSKTTAVDNLYFVRFMSINLDV